MSQIDKIRKAINDKKVEFQKHAVKRMVEENLTLDSIIEVVLNGEIIKNYSDDRPHPSLLILGHCNSRPIHVVCSYNSDAD